MAVGKWFADVQYLIAQADASLLNTIDDSVLAQIMAVDGDVSAYNDNLHSLQAISEMLGGAAGQLRTEQSVSSVVEENAYQQFSISIMDVDSGSVALANIDITGISQVLEKSTGGGAFSAAGITQPTFGKENGRVFEDYQFLAAQWTVGDVYKLVVSGIVATVGGDTAYVPAMVWSNLVVEAADVKAAVDSIQATQGELNTAAATGAVDNATPGIGYQKQLVTGQIVIDGFQDVPTADVADNAQMRDVIGNKTDAAARTADVVSLVGLIRKTLDEATETERHLHNVERWFGPAASASGTTHLADPIGEVGGTPAGVITSFRVTTGPNKTWGTALQVWGSTDYTLMPTGKQAFVDMHRFRITAAETDRKNWYLRVIVDPVSAAAGVTADTYGIIPIFVENTDKSVDPIDMITPRIPQADACMVWIQALNPDDNDADYIDMQFGIHGYPE